MFTKRSVMAGAMAAVMSLPLAGALEPDAPFLLQLATLAALIALGIAVYFPLVHFSGAQRMGTLLKRLRRDA